MDEGASKRKTEEEDITEVTNFLYCVDPSCRKVYTLKKGKGLASGVILPCGHEVKMAIFSGKIIKAGQNAIDMLEWLDRNFLISQDTLDKIEEHGGDFTDALNCKVPDTNL